MTTPDDRQLEDSVGSILASYGRRGELAHLEGGSLPSREVIWGVVEDLLRVLFPGYLETSDLVAADLAVELEPLRERPEDIPLLVRDFVAHHVRRLGRRIESIPVDVMDTLVHHPWPGNIRELENTIHRAVILSRGTSLQLPPFDGGVKAGRTLAPRAETFDDVAASTSSRSCARRRRRGGPSRRSDASGPEAHDAPFEDAEARHRTPGRGDRAGAARWRRRRAVRGIDRALMRGMAP